MHVSENDKNLIQRWSHGAAAVTVNSDCVEVIVFGGWKNGLSIVADTVVLTFGKCIRDLVWK